MIARRCDVLGSNVLDWRMVLVSGRYEGSIELFRFGGGSQVRHVEVTAALGRHVALRRCPAGPGREARPGRALSSVCPRSMPSAIAHVYA